MLYKIGTAMYEVAEDKNCGMFEYDLIKKECIGMQKEKLIIVNGKFESFKEQSELLRRMQNYEKKDIAFILTDLSLFEECKEIISCCSTLLHSSKREDFGKEICKNSIYSFVPDLYYDNDRKKNEMKSNIIMFGGSFGGTINDDANVRKYLLDSEGKVNERFLFFSKNGQNDLRLSYKNYLKVMDVCKYCLCVKRESFVKDMWVTPRLLDSISSHCMPLVDKNYDCHYNHPVEFICNDYDDVNKMIDYFEKNENEKNEIIEMLRKQSLERKQMFKKIINEI